MPSRKQQFQAIVFVKPYDQVTQEEMNKLLNDMGQTGYKIVSTFENDLDHVTIIFQREYWE